MTNGFNKKLADLLGKMDDKVLQTKINTAIDMLKNGDTEDLARKLNKIDKNEFMSKLNELDESRLKELNLNKAELKQRMSNIDMDAVKKMLGEKGPEIIDKIKDIID